MPSGMVHCVAFTWPESIRVPTPFGELLTRVSYSSGVELLGFAVVFRRNETCGSVNTWPFAAGLRIVGAGGASPQVKLM